MSHRDHYRCSNYKVSGSWVRTHSYESTTPEGCHALCESARGAGNCPMFSVLRDGTQCMFTGPLDPHSSCFPEENNGWRLYGYFGMEGLPWVLWVCTVCIYPMANWVVICVLATRSTPTRAVDEQGRISVSDFRFLRVFMDV